MNSIIKSIQNDLSEVKNILPSALVIQLPFIMKLKKDPKQERSFLKELYYKEEVKMQLKPSRLEKCLEILV